jgi:DNA-binding response OmpR family regulator
MKKILIIDDEVKLGVMISRILERKGYQTFMVHDGLEGLELLKQLRVDLVLLDVMMPGMNGIEVCHQIRNTPSFAAIPVLIMTAYQPINAYKKYLEAGADLVLYKPFEVDELLQKIGRLLEPSPTQTSLEAQQSQYT